MEPPLARPAGFVEIAPLVGEPGEVEGGVGHDRRRSGCDVMLLGDPRPESAPRRGERWTGDEVERLMELRSSDLGAFSAEVGNESLEALEVGRHPRSADNGRR